MVGANVELADCRLPNFPYICISTSRASEKKVIHPISILLTFLKGIEYYTFRLRTFTQYVLNLVRVPFKTFDLALGTRRSLLYFREHFSFQNCVRAQLMFANHQLFEDPLKNV